MTRAKHIAISWSRWSDFAQCKRKFFLKYIEKAENFKESGEKSVHLIRGEQLHKQLEKYVLHKLDVAQGVVSARPAMSPETESLVPVLDQMLATYPVVLPETQLAVDHAWHRVEWFDGKAAIRAILDLIGMAEAQKYALIWDYKTGKYQPYAEECGQLHLSAAMVVMLKGLDYVDVSYVFLDSKKNEGIRVTQEQVPGIVQTFNERLEMVNSEVTWAPTRNEYCGWCNANRAQCQFAKRSL